MEDIYDMNGDELYKWQTEQLIKKLKYPFSLLIRLDKDDDGINSIWVIVHDRPNDYTTIARRMFVDQLEQMNIDYDLRSNYIIVDEDITFVKEWIRHNFINDGAAFHLWIVQSEADLRGTFNKMKPRGKRINNLLKEI
jgi:hypothetical protein